jgi:hypothetical protein
MIQFSYTARSVLSLLYCHYEKLTWKGKAIVKVFMSIQTDSPRWWIVMFLFNIHFAFYPLYDWQTVQTSAYIHTHYTDTILH